jgi:hypothetical protein
MSSVLRFQKQRPSNTIFSEYDPTDAWSYSRIVSYVESNNGIFTAPSVITFPTLSDLQSMTNDLDNNVEVDIDPNVATRDLGKTLYMGVEGDDSTQVVLKLVQVIQGANLSNVVYVNVKDITDDMNVGVGRGAW